MNHNRNSLYININLHIDINLYIDFSIYMYFKIYIKTSITPMIISLYQIALD